MKMIENGQAICKTDNEYWFYTVWETYDIVAGFITDNSWNYTNFSNVKKFFKKAK